MNLPASETLQPVTAIPAIRSLSLHQFRNYQQLQICADSQTMLLVGPNGVGKTNILEALSLLNPGRGLRRATLVELGRQQSPEAGWAVHAILGYSGEGEEISLGTGLELAQGGRDKRIIKIDGRKEKNQAALLDYLSIVWVTPQMGQMFPEGGGARRRFLDRLVYGFDPAHASRIYAYEHSMRERNRLLATPAPDNNWLSSLELKMAEYSMAIAAARLSALEHINHELASGHGSFPAAELVIRGEAEEALQAGHQAVDIEDSIAGKLAENRTHDARSGRSSVGAHKTKLEIWLREKKMEAQYCSTGEQKALLLSVILADSRAQARWRGRPPILLLDEVVAHLDKNRRAELFAELDAMGAQSWITGTDEADFSAVSADAQTLHVYDGKITAI